VGNIYSMTMALCGKCGEKVRASIEGRGGKVYMKKFCPLHGESEVLLSSDESWYAGSRAYVKPGQLPLSYATEYHGCPDSCGFCEQHQQHVCLPVIEITSACDMRCPVCLKNFDRQFSFSKKDFAAALGAVLKSEGECRVINISGGEPTCHPGLEDFFRIARQSGVTQITVSTNGLRLLKDAGMRAMFRRYGVISAIQFDGPSAKAATVLRGRSGLYKEKMRLFRLLEEEGNRYSLVCTVARGLNDTDIPSITDFFFRSRALSIMFQPVALAGRGTGLKAEYRLTTDEVVRMLGKSPYVGKDDFNPLPCSHYACFALSYYLASSDGEFLSLKELMGRDFYIESITNRTLPGLDKTAFAKIKGRIYELWSVADSGNANAAVLQRIKRILVEIESSGFSPRRALDAGIDSMKAIFIHSFMDRDTMDLSRLVKCCNPYAQADGKLVPICAHNVFRQANGNRRRDAEGK